MQEEKQYAIVDEGVRIIRGLKDRYPKCFCNIEPEKIVVVAITNVPRPFSLLKLAQISKLSGANRTIIRSLAKRDIQYVVELYASDWVQWSDTRRQWILAHEISHIPPQDSKKTLLKHSIEDFYWILSTVGLDWEERDDLPDLLNGTIFPIDESLFHHVNPEDSEQNSDINGSQPDVCFD